MNTLSPGDKVLSFRYGQFSHLWIDMMQRLGLDVTAVDVEWGEGAPPETIHELLSKDTKHEYKAVCVVHNETATGVTSDIGAVRKAIDAAKHPALLFVDSVSGLASIDFRMDEWKVDICVTGSQKGFMLPAGAGIVCVSPRAIEPGKTAKLPRCYWSFEDMLKANATGYFPYTPSIPMLYGLREALNMLLEEGLENVFARHHRLAEGCRRAVTAWGLSALCPGAEVVLRHGERHHGARRLQRCRRDRRGLPALQLRARRRPEQDGRQAVPDRPPGRPERDHAARRHRRRRDGDAATWASRSDLGNGVAAAQQYWLETADAAPGEEGRAGPAESAAPARRPAGVA